mmetsp:Transcript_86822/g.210617  ORF Transcript_86822/g.210617 Transcript_86822/m.210617 type:complete len:264 (-) Transcript_86822:111-902(-)
MHHKLPSFKLEGNRVAPEQQRTPARSSKLVHRDSSAVQCSAVQCSAPEIVFHASAPTRHRKGCAAQRALARFGSSPTSKKLCCGDAAPSKRNSGRCGMFFLSSTSGKDKGTLWMLAPWPDPGAGVRPAPANSFCCAARQNSAGEAQTRRRSESDPWIPGSTDGCSDSVPPQYWARAWNCKGTGCTKKGGACRGWKATVRECGCPSCTGFVEWRSRTRKPLRAAREPKNGKKKKKAKKAPRVCGDDSDDLDGDARRAKRGRAGN